MRSHECCIEKLARDAARPNADAVDDAEVDCLCLVALGLGDIFKWNTENFRGYGFVNVLIVLKCLHQRRFFGEMRQHAQFHLAVVGGEQNVVGRIGRNKRLADEAALVGAVGISLVIGIAATILLVVRRRSD